jgi:hypothetical protein
MADPAPPPLIDGKVLRSMENLIASAVQVHRLSLEEACGRAWGYCRAYHAWLPADAIDAAIRHCCARLQPVAPVVRCERALW